MNNLSRAIAILDSNPKLQAALAIFERQYMTPPPAIRDVVDTIAKTRGVTLYRESRQ